MCERCQIDEIIKLLQGTNNWKRQLRTGVKQHLEKNKLKFSNAGKVIQLILVDGQLYASKSNKRWVQIAATIPAEPDNHSDTEAAEAQPPFGPEAADDSDDTLRLRGTDGEWWFKYDVVFGGKYSLEVKGINDVMLADGRNIAKKMLRNGNKTTAPFASLYVNVEGRFRNESSDRSVSLMWDDTSGNVKAELWSGNNIRAKGILNTSPIKHSDTNFALTPHAGPKQGLLVKFETKIDDPTWHNLNWTDLTDRLVLNAQMRPMRNVLKHMDISKDNPPTWTYECNEDKIDIVEPSGSRFWSIVVAGFGIREGHTIGFEVGKAQVGDDNKSVILKAPKTSNFGLEISYDGGGKLSVAVRAEQPTSDEAGKSSPVSTSKTP
eukprot:GHVS01083765.1.p1 GENE.GHVS01083765.1~~GHVS01083765.1.p1  ORF type:complete len:378 (+),score=36.43 GHVS01083765.1:547-1680(+)